MLDCIARGVERFNFYGISGIFNANDPFLRRLAVQDSLQQIRGRASGQVHAAGRTGLRFGVSEAAHKLLHR